MKEYSGLIIWVVLAAAVFGVAWYMGYVSRLSNYVQATREELKKCTWPTWEELKGSTILIMISIVLLGGFTTVVDMVVVAFVRLIV
jgi:preprotein translocase subunit SecE